VNCATQTKGMFVVDQDRMNQAEGDRSEVLNGRRPRADVRLINDLLNSNQHCETTGASETGAGIPPIPNASSEPAAAPVAGALPVSVAMDGRSTRNATTPAQVGRGKGR
jgi:hypothetical protein